MAPASDLAAVLALPFAFLAYLFDPFWETPGFLSIAFKERPIYHFGYLSELELLHPSTQLPIYPAAQKQPSARHLQTPAHPFGH